MYQTSAAFDEALENYSRKIGDAKSRIKVAEEELDEAWDHVLELFREFDIERYLAPDGHTLAIQHRNLEPSLNEEKLKKLLTEAQFAQITKPRVDPKLLEAAVLQGVISSDLLEECLESRKTISRVYRPWTREDKIKARVLGIPMP